MTAVTCPGCGATAEITERFTLASTDGPVAHVALSCCDDLDREFCYMTPFGG